MSNDSFMGLTERALIHVGKWAGQASCLAQHLYEMVEGADPEMCDAMADLIKFGYCDEEGKWKGDW